MIIKPVRIVAASALIGLAITGTGCGLLPAQEDTKVPAPCSDYTAALCTEPPSPSPSSSPSSGPSESAGGTGWDYQEGTADDGDRYRSATIADSTGKVRLVFAEYETWGETAYLEFSDGTVDCPTGCTATVSVDGGAPKKVQASRPETPEERLALREPKTLFAALVGATTATLTVPLESGTSTITVEVGGLDPEQLPGWL